jgi:tripartite-type tricarboxylate transporter receptor subunit TctC
MKRWEFIAGLGSVAASPLVARAQAYPSRPVRVIVPFAAAGPTDLFARLVAQKLSGHFGKQFYVENLPGAGGNIGTGQAARSAHDGHTLLITCQFLCHQPALLQEGPL